MDASTTLDPLVLHSPRDALRRVCELVGRAAAARRVWLLLLTADGRELPLRPTLADLPVAPDVGACRQLRTLLRVARAELGSDWQGGSAVVALERRGPVRAAADAAWSHALRRTCEDEGVTVFAAYLCTDAGVTGLP